MSEEKKSESKVDSKSTVSTSETVSVDTASKIVAAKVAAEAAAKAEDELNLALAKVAAAKAAAEAAAEQEYKAIAAEVKAAASKVPAFTYQRKSEEIFRREMGEPEFFLAKKDRFQRPILTAEEQDDLTRKAEIPVDNTPKYVPEHVLSPEFAGVSNYESGVGTFLEDAKRKLKKLKNNPQSTEKDILTTKQEIEYLESLYENYHLGMNVFRTAKGGRSKVKA
jgi:colicin import membrane protein